MRPRCRRLDGCTIVGLRSSAPRRTMLRSAGYTFIELIMVLAVLAVLTAIAYWRMAPALEREKVRRGASVLAADLQYAQMIAARQRQPVVVIVNSSLKMYLIRDRTGTTVYRERFVGQDTDYDLETLSVTPGTSVEVFPNGIALVTTTFTVGIRDQERQVRLTRAGQIRILSP